MRMHTLTYVDIYKYFPQQNRSSVRHTTKKTPRQEKPGRTSRALQQQQQQHFQVFAVAQPSSRVGCRVWRNTLCCRLYFFETKARQKEGMVCPVVLARLFVRFDRLRGPELYIRQSIWLCRSIGCAISASSWSPYVYRR